MRAHGNASSAPLHHGAYRMHEFTMYTHSATDQAPRLSSPGPYFSLRQGGVAPLWWVWVTLGDQCRALPPGDLRHRELGFRD